MSRKDIIGENFPLQPLDPAQLAQGLAKVAAYAIEFTENSAKWYFEGRKSRRWWCRICRFLSVILIGLAGLIPVLTELYPATLQLRPTHATLCLGLAGLWIGIDRFWGFTSGWVRYLQTGQLLASALDGFRFDLKQDQLEWSGGQPTPVQAQAHLARIRAFLLQIHGIISDETRAWASEFAEVLKQFDEQAKAIAQTAAPTALHLTVTNGDQCTAGWNLSVDGSQTTQKSGKSAAVQVQPGLRLIRVQGSIGDRLVSDERPVHATSGDIVKLELTLA
jgi:hypothetical protein